MNFHLLGLPEFFAKKPQERRVLVEPARRSDPEGETRQEVPIFQDPETRIPVAALPAGRVVRPTGTGLANEELCFEAGGCGIFAIGERVAYRGKIYEVVGLSAHAEGGVILRHTERKQLQFALSSRSVEERLKSGEFAREEKDTRRYH